MQTKIVAHRGYSYCYPENTMLAFRKAVEMGCDGIELDVQLSRDGQVVIIHDEKLDRTTDGQGLVRDFTLAELRRLDAGRAYHEQHGFWSIPTLREYFEYMHDKPLFTNIEMKNSIYNYPSLAEKTLELISEFALEDRIQFSSFNHLSMVHCKKLAPNIPTGLLTSSWLVKPGAYTKAVGADFINGIYSAFDSETLDEIRSAGVGCNAWTVDDPKHILLFMQADISSMITNRADLALELATALQ